MKKILSIAFAVMVFSMFGRAQSHSTPTVHIVQWFESLADIAAAYNVSETALMKCNNLTDSTIHARQKLIIPDGSESVPDSAVRNDSTARNDIAAKSYIASRNDSTASVSEIRIGLLLPFSLVPEIQVDHSLDFYCGALMAAKKLGENGLDITLDVKDFSNTSASSLCGNDFIVGPIKSEDIAVALSQITDSTLLISPLDAKASTLTGQYANLVQAASHSDAQYDRIPDWMVSDSLGITVNACNYIILYSENDMASLEEAKKALSTRNLQYHTAKCGVQGEIEGWAGIYSPFIHNKVIVATTIEAVINNALRNLGIAISQRNNITVFGNNKIKSFEKSNPELIYKTQVHSLCSYYTDYKDPETLSFIHSYRALFNAEPTQFAYQGYDLILYMAETYAKYGRVWKEMIPDHEENGMLQCSFKFERDTNGSLINHGVRKVEYSKDFQMRLIK